MARSTKFGLLKYRVTRPLHPPSGGLWSLPGHSRCRATRAGARSRSLLSSVLKKSAGSDPESCQRLEISLVSARDWVSFSAFHAQLVLSGCSGSDLLDIRGIH